MKLIDEELRIEDAFCWEGTASVFFNEVDIKEKEILLTLQIGGHSTVEHTGDEDEIESQVKALDGEKGRFELKGNLFDVSVLATSCNITGSCSDDRDYTVHVTGLVYLKIEKYENK